MTENAKNSPENVDFQGFSENFVGIPAPKFALSREAQEVLAEMEKRLGRIQRAMPLYRRNAPRALREEEELLEANIAHFKRRWGLTE